MSEQVVYCMRCCKNFTVELNGAKPYGIDKPFTCGLCIKERSAMYPEFGYGVDY